jgi:hypothetical protein
MSDDGNTIIMFPGSATVVSNPVRNDQLCPAEDVVNGALKAGVSRIVVVGIDAEGDLYLAANDRQMADVLMLLKRAEILVVRAETQEC